MRVEKQTSKFRGEEETTRTSSPNQAGTERPPLRCRPLISSDGLTRSQRRELQRRERIVQAFDSLLTKGMTKAAAAKELRTGYTTIWRWKNRRIVPTTANCGVHSTLEKLNPPAALLALVRQRQLGGMGNAAAWLSIANDPRCPAELSEHLKAGRVAPSLLAATKLKRRKIVILEAPGILVLKQ